MPDVTLAKLTQLLSLGTESDTLDFKRSFDLQSKRSWIELAKDVGAMQIHGGYLVFGVDGKGQPVPGLTSDHSKSFDEANLRNKLKQWIPEPFHLYSASYEVDSALLIIVQVEPHVDGFCIFKADGEIPDAGQVFKRGDVFARHGTSSERWQQADIDIIKKRMLYRFNKNEKRIAYSKAIPKSRQVIGQCSGMIDALIKAAKIQTNADSITKEQLEAVCKRVDPNGKAELIVGRTSAGSSVSGTHFQFVMYWRSRSNKFTLEALKFEMFLEAQHLKWLADIEECSLFAQMDFYGNGRIDNRNLEWLHTSFWTYIELTRAFGLYLNALEVDMKSDD